ncbi:hypothetical protein PG999_003679 [Apiospora kogelbergensis]|uniref:Ankyrin repeat-containing protein n=1 Tax=Apiospora kogelbergensis TaxID=1337665 RepID=A0AAW0R4H2_9PEZI
MSAPARTSRTQTISYVDLMKPDEDWRNLPDASERRKIQNRLAQRAYSMCPFPPKTQSSQLLTVLLREGRNMRDRTREVERLKSQLKKLREEKEEGEDAPSLAQAQEEEDDSGSDSGSSSTSMKGDAATQMDDLSPSTIATSEWLGRYFQAWPDSTEPERAVCMDMSPDGDGLAHLDNTACYSDYQLNPDYPQQIIAPRPMLSKAQGVLPGHFNLEHHQHTMQSSRAMNESMFHPKGAYQMPSWPSHSQRNVAFEPMGDPTASEQARRVAGPSSPADLGQLDLASVSQASQPQHSPSKPTVGRLLNAEHSVNRNGGKVNETVPGGFPSPISELSEQVWQRAKLSSPSPSLIPPRPSSQSKQRQQNHHQQQQQQQQQTQQQQQHDVPTSACTQQTTSSTMTSIAETTRSQACRRASLSTTRRRPPSPEKSPVLEKKQKQKKNEAGHRKSRSATPNSTNKTNAADQQMATAAMVNTTAASPPPPSLLHLAVGGGHIDTLRLLLQRLDAAALNARDERGYTALECAVMEGRTDLVALLLEHGAGLSR